MEMGNKDLIAMFLHRLLKHPANNNSLLALLFSISIRAKYAFGKLNGPVGYE
jgi:hypothetical protein